MKLIRRRLGTRTPLLLPIMSPYAKPCVSLSQRVSPKPITTFGNAEQVSLCESSCYFLTTWKWSREDCRSLCAVHTECHFCPGPYWSSFAQVYSIPISSKASIPLPTIPKSYRGGWFSSLSFDVWQRMLMRQNKRFYLVARNGSKCFPPWPKRETDNAVGHAKRHVSSGDIDLTGYVDVENS